MVSESKDDDFILSKEEESISDNGLTIDDNKTTQFVNRASYFQSRPKETHFNGLTSEKLSIFIFTSKKAHKRTLTLRKSTLSPHRSNVQSD